MCLSVRGPRAIATRNEILKNSTALGQWVKLVNEFIDKENAEDTLLVNRILTADQRKFDQAILTCFLIWEDHPDQARYDNLIKILVRHELQELTGSTAH